jgi:GDP/UDP-N,N'-diacetylbacillosamine 2-epimerase (hydrolysing)
MRYLSALQYVDAVVGNSSSGLIEAPSFKIGTINIGDRQKGRIKAASVIDSQPNKESISAAIAFLQTPQFQQTLKNVINPYGAGGSSRQIVKKLATVNLDNILFKSFFDLPFNWEELA